MIERGKTLFITQKRQRQRKAEFFFLEQLQTGYKSDRNFKEKGKNVIKFSKPQKSLGLWFI